MHPKQDSIKIIMEWFHQRIDGSDVNNHATIVCVFGKIELIDTWIVILSEKKRHHELSLSKAHAIVVIVLAWFRMYNLSQVCQSIL
jgi:hypothetical protein